MGINLKFKVWEKSTSPTLMYGAQTWALTRANLNRLESTQKATERSLLGIKKRDKRSNEVIREKSGMVDLRYRIAKIKCRPYRTTKRRKMGKENRGVDSKRQEVRKRYRGKPIRRWNDEIKSEVGPWWRRLARNRREWQARGEAHALKRAGTGGKEKRILTELHQTNKSVGTYA